MKKNLYTPPTGPPKSPLPSKEIYQQMGKQNIETMLLEFYQNLGKSSIKDMFPKSETGLKQAATKSAAFFIQLCGGPLEYQNQYGSPMMRQRHFPFKIDQKAQKEWLRCFLEILNEAPKKYQFPVQHLQAFKIFISEFSEWMVNTK